MIVTITDMEKTKTKYASRWGNITITKKKKTKKNWYNFKLLKCNSSTSRWRRQNGDSRWQRQFKMGDLLILNNLFLMIIGLYVADMHTVMTSPLSSRWKWCPRRCRMLAVTLRKFLVTSHNNLQLKKKGFISIIVVDVLKRFLTYDHAVQDSGSI